VNGGYRHPETDRNLVHSKIRYTFIYPYAHIRPIKMGKNLSSKGKVADQRFGVGESHEVGAEATTRNVLKKMDV
jgi:hypothetical protein